MKKIMKPIIGAALMAFASGCAFTDPQQASVVAQPKAKPVRNITSFTPALRCMDELFVTYGVQNVVITSAGIPDATGKIGGGTKDMLISAVSQMSVRSQAFTFVDFDQTQADVAQLQSLVGITDEFRVPSYYIRGAITQSFGPLLTAPQMVAGLLDRLAGDGCQHRIPGFFHLAEKFHIVCVNHQLTRHRDRKITIGQFIDQEVAVFTAIP